MKKGDRAFFLPVTRARRRSVGIKLEINKGGLPDPQPTPQRHISSARQNQSGPAPLKTPVHYAAIKAEETLNSSTSRPCAGEIFAALGAAVHGERILFVLMSSASVLMFVEREDPSEAT